MSWLVTPPGQALPPAGTVTDNGAQAPGLSFPIPEEWGPDPNAWPTDWFESLPTTEAFRYTRTPDGALPPFLEIPYGVTTLRLGAIARPYQYALSVEHVGTTAVRLKLVPRGETTVRLQVAGQSGLVFSGATGWWLWAIGSVV